MSEYDILQGMKIQHLATLKQSAYFRNGDLPCLVRIMKAAPSNDIIALHGHEFSEIVLIVSGSLKHIQPSKTERLKRGDFLVIHPGIRHGYAELSGDTVVYNLLYRKSLRQHVCLNINNPLLKHIFPLGSNGVTPNVLGTLDTRLIARTVRLLNEIAHEEKAHSPNADECCGALFSTVVSLMSRTIPLANVRSPQKDSLKLEATLQYMSEHIAEKLSLTSIADVAHCSPSTLNRRFHAVFGEGTFDHLIEMRLDLASRLLSNSIEPLCRIATLCGFSDASHMCHTFSRRRHMRPSSLRQENRCASCGCN